MRVTAPAPGLGSVWTRVDYFALSAITALVVLVIGLVIGLTATSSTTVQSKPAPTATSFTVASGEGKALLCGPNVGIEVGGTEAHIAAIDGDRVTLAAPLSSAPASGATVTEGTLGPATLDSCAAVAASPAPTTTQFTLAGGPAWTSATPRSSSTASRRWSSPSTPPPTGSPSRAR